MEREHIARSTVYGDLLSSGFGVAAKQLDKVWDHQDKEQRAPKLRFNLRPYATKGSRNQGSETPPAGRNTVVSGYLQDEYIMEGVTVPIGKLFVHTQTAKDPFCHMFI
jgi:hypothetical protein